MTTTTFPTAKQQYWIEKCLAEREVPPVLVEQAVSPLSKAEASELLGKLFKLPRVKAAAPVTAQPKQEPAQVGYYLLDGTPYVVVESKRTGHRSAKRLVLPGHPGGRAKWIYEKGAVFKLTGDPLTLAQAAQFGHLHGYCLVCGAALDVPLSVDAGIGPTCIKKHFGMTQMQWIIQRDQKGGE